MIAALPAGDAGLLIETEASPAQLATAITGAGLTGILDVVPGARTVLVTWHPGRWTAGALASVIESLPVAATPLNDALLTEIPVCYDGPDLTEVGELTGLTADQVIGCHAAGEYTVGWLGFSPGFGYLTGLGKPLGSVPRLASPRISVPAGSVAIAGGLAAVYPSASPGGWRLLGRTTTPMWDAGREPPALLAPGSRVRFRPVQASELPRPPLAVPAGQGGITRQAAPASGRCLEVIRPGPLASVQDLGRPGHGAIGVPPSGAADIAGLVLANRLVGNHDAEAGLELTLGRASFRCHGAVRLATAGAPASITVTAGPGHAAREVAAGTAFEVADGEVVSIGSPSAGLRSYLAVAGGIVGPAVLGSRSADLLSGLGGGPLRPGDLLPIGSASAITPGSATAQASARVPVRGQPTHLRIVAGPRRDWFGTDSLSTLCGPAYQVGAASNRTGLRLDGPALIRITDAELPSEGMVTGSLQVPHDGKPILLLADHPTVGGYPVIAALASTDIGLAAQLRPGDQIVFTRA